MTMKIIRADKAGFCFGVERAVSIAREALGVSKEAVHSLGPIIHNPQVVRDLEEAGLRVVQSLDDAHSGTVIIRSHGAPHSPQHFGGDPARMHGSISLGGKVAKWASE